MLHDLAEGIDGVLVASVFHASATGNEDRPGAITHHAIGDVDSMVEAIDAHLETPGANVYVGPQVMRRGLGRGKRGTESDIVAVLALVVDLDTDTGKAGDLPLEPPYVLETSPGNWQPFYLLDRPLSVGEAKPLAAALRRATSSDAGTSDVCHVWRIPGTKNWPNAKKLARGRSPDPVPVSVAAEWDGSLTSVEELRAALASWMVAPAASKSATLGDLPDSGSIVASPSALEMLAANDVGDRSAHSARVVEKLAFDGHTMEEAAALFLSADGDWLARYSHEENARKDFERLWSKFGQPKIDEREATAVHASSIAALVAKKPAKEAPVAANDNKAKDKWPGIISSGDLVRGFKPPDYFLEGVAQCGFLYALTALTGAGKTSVLLLLCALAALGKPLGEREVRKGRAIYFAGENPDDVTMRWIGMSHHMPFDPEAIDVHFIKGTFSIPAMFRRIKDDVTRLGGADLVIIDTSAAYFQGQDENSNTELGKHARELRELTTLPGAPCVLVAAHPTKSADQGNLLPRGGGAFLNELDGNLVIIKVADGAIRLHWQGKHRGPDFEPVPFELTTVTAPQLRDSKGRDIPTVMASVVSSGEVRAKRAVARRDEDDILLLIDRDGKQSLYEMAESLGWRDEGGKTHKARASRASAKLKTSKLAEYKERIGWRLTTNGYDALVEVKAQRHSEESVAGFVSALGRKAPHYGDDD